RQAAVGATGPELQGPAFNRNASAEIVIPAISKDQCSRALFIQAARPSNAAGAAKSIGGRGIIRDITRCQSGREIHGLRSSGIIKGCEVPLIVYGGDAVCEPVRGTDVPVSIHVTLPSDGFGRRRTVCNNEPDQSIRRVIR